MPLLFLEKIPEQSLKKNVKKMQSLLELELVHTNCQKVIDNTKKNILS
jgi:hypothetical protein